ncbi:PLP-dependent transferase [Russula aff. rugulosa BPL654]|nr:PLP-dependent transferase [Russula aff. rugulosa BPL654]
MSLDKMFMPTKPPPPFGHQLRQYFGFEADYVNMNSGAYGVVSNPVLAATEATFRSIDGNIDRFIKLRLSEHLDPARHRMANCSHGLNTILRNLLWNEGDIIIGGMHRLAICHERTLQYIADLPPHPSISIFELQFPTTRASALQAFRVHLSSLNAELQISQRKIGNRTKLKIVAVINSIASVPGVYLPWKEMVALCRERGILTVIDAAHSIGQEPNINLSEADPDFWASNCYKWFYGCRPCGILYVPRRNLHLIQSSFPTSDAYVSPKEQKDLGGSNFVPMFDWTALADYSKYLSIQPALDFRQWLGGEEKIHDYCHSLALSGGERLSQLLGTSLMDPTGEFTLNMTNVELPLAPSIPNNGTTLEIVRNLLERWRVSATIFQHNGKWWVRVCAQVWNEISDFEYLAKALKDSCEKVDRRYHQKVAGKL